VNTGARYRVTVNPSGRCISAEQVEPTVNEIAAEIGDPAGAFHQDKALASSYVAWAGARRESCGPGVVR
jgi:hypothetical protein